MHPYIDQGILEDLAVGATVLGAGGDPYLGKLMARQAIELYGPVELVAAEEIAGDGLVLPVAMMGAPTVLVEKIPNGAELKRVINAVENRLGEKAAALMSVEAGGINSTIPIVAAAELGLPLLDADGMGRAFPEIPMCSMSVRGISATPMALADEKGNLGLIETVDNTWTERLSRTATVEMGGSSIIALYPMTVEQGTSSVIRGTMSRAVEIGESVRTARERDLDALDALLETTRGRLLFRGKVVDVLRRTVEGFARGTAKVEGLQEYSGSSLELEFQNEHLVAVRDGEPLVTVPDLIAVLDADNRTPITTEGISYGARIEVVGLPCAPIWRSPEALEIVGPDYFGYPFSYSPLEEVEA